MGELDDKNGIRETAAAKRLLKAAIESNIKYQEICDAIPDSAWNSNSLKQFVFRSSNSRPSEKTKALSRVLLRLFDEDNRISEKRETFAQERRLLSFALGLAKRHEPNVSNSFRDLSQNSNKSSLPEQLSFVRFGRKKEKMVIVLINFHREDDSTVFTMKISGNSKRVIVGQVLFTQPITYLSGLAYPVVTDIGDEQFSKLKTHNFKSDPNFLSTPIGIETIAIKNTDILYGICPASFMGLDGWGNPFVGNGVIIPESKFDFYEIPPHIVSAVDCADKNTPLKELLEKADGNTITYPEGGAPGLHIHMSA